MSATTPGAKRRRSPPGRGEPNQGEVDYDQLELRAIRLTEAWRQAHGRGFMRLRDYLRCFQEAGWLCVPDEVEP